ncbi:MAG: hypothetical protein HYU64_19180, partial [Armatimonadetes bacterium]|nr:hypothetical protein [Armatimonadota bacterium]
MLQYFFGEFHDTEPVTPEQVHALVSEAGSSQRRLQEIPVESILDVLDQTGRLWLDPDYPLRKRALQEMPPRVGFSPEMTREALEALGQTLLKEHLQQKLCLELSDPAF